MHHNCLIVIPEFAPALGLSKGSELVKSTVIYVALSYLIERQEESGRFPVIGQVHNYYLLVHIHLLCSFPCRPFPRTVRRLLNYEELL